MQSNERGQLLIESLVAITIILIAVVGIFSLLSRSLSLTRVISDQYTGTYLAAEGLEVVKNIVDTNFIKRCQNWNSGFSSGNYSVSYDSASLEELRVNPLNFNPVTGLYSYESGGQASKFRRDIHIQIIEGGEAMHVESKVQWKTRGAAEFESVLEDTFYGWRPQSAECL
ncbi:MAG: hypothetical protein Q8P45_01220 [Candidatus Harrisonbacteria bacterium]|nr:hypothetical protein [Candidatus Harrisonbacteria bacterium]